MPVMPLDGPSLTSSWILSVPRFCVNRFVTVAVVTAPSTIEETPGDTVVPDQKKPAGGGGRTPSVTVQLARAGMLGIVVLPDESPGPIVTEAAKEPAAPQFTANGKVEFAVSGVPVTTLLIRNEPVNGRFTGAVPAAVTGAPAGDVALAVIALTPGAGLVATIRAVKVMVNDPPAASDEGRAISCGFTPPLNDGLAVIELPGPTPLTTGTVVERNWLANAVASGSLTVRSRSTTLPVFVTTTENPTD